MKKYLNIAILVMALCFALFLIGTVIENNKLKEEVVYQKNVLNGEQFEASNSEKAIEFVDINDLSIIDKM